MALDFPNSPTNGQLYTSNNVTWEYDSSTSTWDVKYDGVAGTTRVALLKDQKNFGVNGGIFTKDAWRDRDLTVKEDPQNFVTFFPTANGQTTPSPADAPGYWSLPAGTYKIDWSAPAFEVNRHKSRLVWSTTQLEISTAGLHANIVAAGDIAEGSNADTTNTGTGGGSDDEHVTTQSSGFKIITITETTYFKILHWAVVTRGDVSNPDGLGEGMSPGGSYDTGSEIYTQVRIEDLYTTVKNNATYVEGTSRIASVKDVKGNTDPGGQITANTWTTRDLNTIADPSSIGISVSSDSSGTGNYMTVPAGTYKITWKAPGWRLYTFQTKLEYSIDSTFATGVTKVIGSSEFSSSLDSNNVSATSSEGLLASVTFTQETYVRIRQWAGVTGPTAVLNGLGVASYNDVASTYSGESSIYTTVQIEDLATAVKDNATYVEGTTRVAILRDQKNYDIGGGYFYGDYWRDRDLTVIEDPENLLTSFTATTNGQTTASTGTTPGYWSLPAGTYEIQWGAGGFNVNRHQTRLVWSTTQSDMTWTTVEPTYSTTTADNPPDETSRFVNNECFGSSENGSENSQTTWSGAWSTGTKVITITETTYFKVLHICGTDDAEGFGSEVDNSNFSPDRYTTGKNIYAEVRITDLATAVKDNATYVEGTSRVAFIEHREDSSVGDLGAFTQNVWATRKLNHTVDPHSIVSLDSGYEKFSLAAGTYRIKWSAPAVRCDRHQTKLVYASDASFTSPTQIDGSSEIIEDSDNLVGTRSFGETVLTFSGTRWFKIQQIMDGDSGNSSKGLNTAGIFSAVTDPPTYSIYTQVSVEDLATAVKDNATYVEGNSKVARVYDEKSQNTGAGSPSGVGFEDRTLNQTDDPFNLIDLDSGHVYFSLLAGTYKLSWRVPSQDGGHLRSKLVYANNTSFTSSSEVLGESGLGMTSGDEDNYYTYGQAILTTTEVTYFKIQQAQAGGNLGAPCNLGGPEIYTQVFVEDLATAVKDDGTSSIVKQIKHASGPATQQSYNGASWTTIVQQSITLTSPNNVLIDVKAGFYGGDEGTAYNGGRLLRTTSSTDTSLWEYSSIWGRKANGPMKAAIDGPTVVDTPGTGTHTYQWQTYQHDASGSNNIIVPANGNSITLTEYT